MTHGFTEYDIPGGHWRDTPPERDPKHTGCDPKQTTGDSLSSLSVQTAVKFMKKKRKKRNQDTCHLQYNGKGEIKSVQPTFIRPDAISQG